MEGAQEERRSRSESLGVSTYRLDDGLAGWTGVEMTAKVKSFFLPSHPLTAAVLLLFLLWPEIVFMLLKSPEIRLRDSDSAVCSCEAAAASAFWANVRRP